MIGSCFSLPCFEDLTKGWHVKFRSYWAGCWGVAAGDLICALGKSLHDSPCSRHLQARETWQLLLEFCSSLEGSGRQAVVADSATDWSSLCPCLSFLFILDGDNKASQHSESSFTGEQFHNHSQRFLLSFLNESTCCPLFPRRGQVFLVCKEGKVFFFKYNKRPLSGIPESCQCSDQLVVLSVSGGKHGAPQCGVSVPSPFPGFHSPADMSISLSSTTNANIQNWWGQ